MKVLELFAGTRSIGKAFQARGHEVFSVDWDEQRQDIDLHEDVLTITAAQVIGKFGRPDVIWASPDCTTYSIAAISRHRAKDESGDLTPISAYARYCDRVNLHVHGLIMALAPRYWFIENPRGGMRKMGFMSGLPRYTVTYCQYGDTRMKPTDIWTNHPDPKFKPPCRNGDPCHVPAPRGANTGTQGLKGSVERGKIPRELCEHIVDICEEGSFQPPNAPLTLEELREMDGPVWVQCCSPQIAPNGGYYCLCINGVITTPAATRFDADEIPHWKFYRRKPGEGAP